MLNSNPADDRFFPVPCPVIRLAADGAVLALNAAAGQLFGYPIALPPVRTWVELFPDAPLDSDLGRSPTSHQGLRADGSPFSARVLTLRDGAEWYAFVFPAADAGPPAPAGEHTARHIIERTHSFAIFTLNMGARVTSWNAGAYHIVGYAADEILGKQADILFTPEDRAQNVPQQELDKAARTGQAEDVRWHVRKDGSRFFANGFMMSLRDDAGAVYAFAKIMRDDTPRKLAEDALATQKKQLDATVQSMGEGLIALDTNGVVTLINDAASELTGWPTQDAVGRSASEIFRVELETEPGRVIDVSGLIAENHATVAPMRLTARDRTERTVQFSATPIRHEGATLGAVIVFRDIAERRRLLQALERAQRLESLGQLAGGIAHNFNNVLTALFGNIALAKAYAGADAHVRSALDDAERAFHQARELTQKFLSLSPQGAPQRARESMAGIVNDLVASEPLRSRSDIERPLRLRMAHDLPEVFIDSAQILEALHHVVVNAIEAMPSGGAIQLEAVRETVSAPRHGLPPGEYVHVFVKDSGNGIAPELLAQIFEPYFTTKQTGSGLGLTIAHAIVQRHGGQMDVHSKLGHGTTVHIYLPAASDG